MTLLMKARLVSPLMHRVQRDTRPVLADGHLDRWVGLDRLLTDVNSRRPRDRARIRNNVYTHLVGVPVTDPSSMLMGSGAISGASNGFRPIEEVLIRC